RLVVPPHVFVVEVEDVAPFVLDYHTRFTFLRLSGRTQSRARSCVQSRNQFRYSDVEWCCLTTIAIAKLSTRKRWMAWMFSSFRTGEKMSLSTGASFMAAIRRGIASFSRLNFF